MKLVENKKVLSIEFEYSNLHDFNGNLEIAMELLRVSERSNDSMKNVIKALEPFHNQFERILLDNEYD